MYSDAVKKRGALRWIALALLILLAAALLIVWKPGRDLGDESAAAIREAICRSALQCYAVEGVYPPNLQYLQDNYGLEVNTEDFYVTYDAFASNLPPTVLVTSKK